MYIMLLKSPATRRVIFGALPHVLLCMRCCLAWNSALTQTTQRTIADTRAYGIEQISSNHQSSPKPLRPSYQYLLIHSQPIYRILGSVYPINKWLYDVNHITCILCNILYYYYMLYGLCVIVEDHHANKSSLLVRYKFISSILRAACRVAHGCGSAYGAYVGKSLWKLESSMRHSGFHGELSSRLKMRSFAKSIPFSTRNPFLNGHADWQIASSPSFLFSCLRFSFAVTAEISRSDYSPIKLWFSIDASQLICGYLYIYNYISAALFIVYKTTKTFGVTGILKSVCKNKSNDDKITLIMVTQNCNKRKTTTTINNKSRCPFPHPFVCLSKRPWKNYFISIIINSVYINNIG